MRSLFGFIHIESSSAPVFLAHTSFLFLFLLVKKCLLLCLLNSLLCPKLSLFSPLFELLLLYLLSLVLLEFLLLEFSKLGLLSLLQSVFL